MPTPLEKGADVRFIGPVMGRYTLESRVRLSGAGRDLLANAEVRAAYLEGGHG